MRLNGLEVTDMHMGAQVVQKVRLNGETLYEHQPPLFNGLQAFWEFAETGAGPRIDSIEGASINPTAALSTYTGVGGVGHCLAFPNNTTTDTFGTFPQANIFGTSHVTFCFWARLSSWVNGSRVLFDFRGGTAGAGVRGTLHNGTISISASGNGFTLNSHSTAPMFLSNQFNQWHMHTIRLNCANSMSYYTRDTTTVASATTQHGQSFVIPDHGPQFAINHNLTYEHQYRIGSRMRLDKLGIWNRLLSSAEITELYNAGAGWTP